MADAAAGGDNGVRALLLGLFEDAGVSVGTDAERTAFQTRLVGIREAHCCSWTEHQKLKRHFERGSLSAFLSTPATQKNLSITHLISAFATLPTGEGNAGPILTAPQANRAICALLELSSGNFNFLDSEDGVPKKQAAEIWRRAMENCANSPATVNITQRNKWSLILKVSMDCEIRGVANLAKVERKLAEVEAANANPSKRRKVEEAKSFVCLPWLKNECPGGCGDSHRANKGTIDFLNKKFSLNLAPDAVLKKAGGK